MDFGHKKIREFDLFDFVNFVAWTFLNFLARCGFTCSKFKKEVEFMLLNIGPRFLRIKKTASTGSNITLIINFLCRKTNWRGGRYGKCHMDC